MLDVVLHEVEEVGSSDFVDLYEFPPLVDDEYTGEGRVIGSARSVEDALARASAEGAQPGRWVNEGVIQEEHLDSLR